MINEPAKIFPHKRNEIEINGVIPETISIGLIITGIDLLFLVLTLNVKVFK